MITIYLQKNWVLGRDSGLKQWLIGWRICFVSIVLLFFTVSGLCTAQDQEPPYGYDKEVWVLIEKKPDVEAETDWDSGLYYNQHVSLSGSTVRGGYSWKDGDDPEDCKGEVWGTITWDELPGILQPGAKQHTTITAEAGGSQSCSARHPGACSHLELNEESLEPHPCIYYSSGEPKPDPETVTVSWEAPWGKIGDTLTVTVWNRVSGSIRAHVYYIYSYQANAPAVLPYSFEEEKPQRWGNEKTPSLEPTTKPVSCEMEYFGADSGVRVSGVTGQVDIRPCNDEDAWRGVGLKSVIYVGDIIRTGEGSSVILSFPNMCTFVMKPESEISIDNPPKDSKMCLINGKILVNIKKMFQDGSMQVQMSQAVAGIKGTIIVCEETGTSSTLKVLEGSAYFRSMATGEERLAKTGEMMIATIDGLSQPQPFDIESEEASWEDYLPETRATVGSDMGTNDNIPLVSLGVNYSGEAISEPKNGKTWPFKLTLIGPDTDGSISGQIEWTSLNSIHQIEGFKTATGITFTETAYIKKGGAVLNCRYNLNYDGDSFTGTYGDEDSCDDRDYGTISMNPE